METFFFNFLEAIDTNVFEPIGSFDKEIDEKTICIPALINIELPNKTKQRINVKASNDFETILIALDETTWGKVPVEWFYNGDHYEDIIKVLMRLDLSIRSFCVQHYDLDLGVNLEIDQNDNFTVKEDDVYYKGEPCELTTVYLLGETRTYISTSFSLDGN